MPLGEWTRRLGALPAEAYDCFMVGTYMGSTEYTRGSRAIARGQWQAPLGSSRGKPPDPAVLALDHQAARHAPAKPSAPMSTTTRGNPPTRPPPRGTARRRQPRAARGEFAKFLSDTCTARPPAAPGAGDAPLDRHAAMARNDFVCESLTTLSFCKLVLAHRA